MTALEGRFRLARSYGSWAAGLACLFLAVPAIGYFIFLEVLPRFELGLLLGLLTVIAFASRCALALTGLFPLRTSLLGLAYVLLAWVSVLQIVWLPSLLTEVDRTPVMGTVGATLAGAWLLLLGGEALAFVLLHRPAIARRWIFAVWLVLTSTILVGTLRAFHLHGQLFFLFQNPFTKELYNYLALADSLALVALLLVGTAMHRRYVVAIALSIGTAVLLFVTYSRASLLVFLLVAPVILWNRARGRWRHRLVLAFAAALALILFAAVWDPGTDVLGRLHGSLARLVERYQAPFVGADASHQARVAFQEQGLVNLGRHWLLGSFMAEAVEAGPGSYMHNWLSFWVAYGIGPFALSIWLAVSAVARSWRCRRDALLGSSRLAVLLFTLLSVALFRSYVWPFVWFGMGFVAGSLPPLTREVRA